jgi:hypothetical protein
VSRQLLSSFNHSNCFPRYARDMEAVKELARAAL